MDMKRCFSTLGCPGLSWNEIFATSKDLGMKGIEVRGVANEMFVPKIKEFSEGRREDTLARLEKAGMEISMLTSGCLLYTSGAGTSIMTGTWCPGMPRPR